MNESSFVRKVQKTGVTESLCIVIPRPLARLAGLQSGDELSFSFENEKIVIEKR